MDDKIPSNWDSSLPVASPFATQSFSAGLNGLEPPPNFAMLSEPIPRKDYQAWAEAEIYQKVSSNGSVQSLEVEVKMYDDKNGSGKASLVIGKDAKKRSFEIPITIKDGVPKLDKAIDKDTNKVIDITKGTEDMFFPPDGKVISDRLDKTYGKYKKFFAGKPDKKKAEILVKKYPSLTTDEAESYLTQKYQADDSGIVAGIKKHRKKLIIGASIIAGLAYLAYMKNKAGE